MEFCLKKNIFREEITKEEGLNLEWSKVFFKTNYKKTGWENENSRSSSCEAD